MTTPKADTAPRHPGEDWIPVKEPTAEEWPWIEVRYDEERTDWPAKDEEGHRRRRRVPTYVIYNSPHPEIWKVEEGAPNRTIGVPEAHTLGIGGMKGADGRRKIIRRRLGIPNDHWASPVRTHETPGVRTLESLKIGQSYGNWGEVPKRENQIEAGRRSRFYQRHELSDLDRYLHVVAPQDMPDFIAMRRNKKK